MTMSSNIESKIMNDWSLTEEEAQTYLNLISKQVRTRQNIADPYDTDCSKCFECSKDIGIVLMGNEVLPTPINIRNQLNIPLTHFATAITLKVNDQYQSYLIDLTYSQFFKDEFVLDNLETGSINRDNKKQEQKDFEDELRNKGFVLLTEDSFKFYVNNFFELCNIKDRLVKNTRLNEFRIYLNKYGIVIKGVNFSTKKELLTQLKDEIKSNQNNESEYKQNKTL